MNYAITSISHRDKLTKKAGPTLDNPHYPWHQKEQQYGEYTDEQLEFAMADAAQAAKTSDGRTNSGVDIGGWYMDDYWTILKEINRRKKILASVVKHDTNKKI